jgi:hypothetical protein
VSARITKLHGNELQRAYLQPDALPLTRWTLSKLAVGMAIAGSDVGRDSPYAWPFVGLLGGQRATHESAEHLTLLSSPKEQLEWNAKRPATFLLLY